MPAKGITKAKMSCLNDVLCLYLLSVTYSRCRGREKQTGEVTDVYAEEAFGVVIYQAAILPGGLSGTALDRLEQAT